MIFYEITQELLDKLNNIEVNEDGEIVNAEELEAAQIAFNEKAESVGLYIKNLIAEADAIDAEMKNLKSRKESKEKKAEWLKAYIDSMLQAVGTDKLETSKIKLSYRTSASVNVLDMDMLADEYKKVKTTIDADKTAIKNAIKSGLIVEGAELVEKKNLQIK